MLTGREYIYTLGIYDYRRRHYHPELGRFIQTDPTGLQIEGAKLSAQVAALYPAGKAPATFSASELNLYRYCHNDPINKSDPMGLYGEGRGWSKSGWEGYKKKQAEAIQDITNRLGNMTKESFEEQFGKGTWTQENVAQKTDELGTMLRALKDDGSKGY